MGDAEKLVRKIPATTIQATHPMIIFGIPPSSQATDETLLRYSFALNVAITALMPSVLSFQVDATSVGKQD
jgi:hypothetical protein